MEPVVVVGAGISGVACARTLDDAGIPVRVLDRGHRIGGRMATRTFAGRPVDTGASYLTVSEERFAPVVRRWQERGLAHEWTDTFTVLSADAAPERKHGPVRWGTAGGLRTLVEDLATGLDVRRQQVEHVRLGATGPEVDGTPASAVVLAMPDAQAARLLGDELATTRAVLDRAFEPVLALTAAYAARAWDPDGSFDGGFVNGDDVLAWIADDGRRRGDGAAVLVAHSTSAFATPRLADPAAAEGALLAALTRLLDVRGEPDETHVQRWTLAKPTGQREAEFQLSEELVGVCGDGWGAASKVEGAWLSGVRLGDALVSRLQG